MIRLVILTIALALAGCASRSVRDMAIDYLALCHAARAGDELLVEALLARGAPVEPMDVDAAGMISYMGVQAQSPLQNAADAGNSKVVSMILARKPWVDHRCCSGPPALGIAARAGKDEIVRLLLDAGADPLIKSHYGQGLPSATALDVARANAHVETVAILEAAMASTPPDGMPR